ncbi:MAG: tryptophan transporter [Bacillota bacterium]
MNLRKNILTALLLAIGYIMHQVIPGTLGSMKFDLMLAFIFVALLINKSFSGTLLTAMLSGAITAMTTTFPGGQIPNVIDKLITCLVVYLLIMAVEKYRYNQLAVGAIAFIGTIISGAVFLYSALLIAGLPAPFMLLFTTIVLPTSITNIVVTLIIYNAAMLAIKATGMKLVQ